MSLGSILITGGTGFFAKAFVSKLLNDNLSDRICIYSRDEYKQAMMDDEFRDSRLRFFIGDVRDKDRLKMAMHGIDVVIHAAALKRIEVGRYNPNEMVKTNVMGTVNVVDACQYAGVKKLVYLSTDKAYAPISPYGQTKALGEAIVLGLNETSGSHGTKSVVTRYGNVMGSTGSVIPKWRSAIAQGKQIYITDPNATRYFMHGTQAVDLVLNSIEKENQIIIPNLPAFSLGALASAMDVKDPIITGLPEWEKKHESMGCNDSSETATRLTVDEIKEELKHV